MVTDRHTHIHTDRQTYKHKPTPVKTYSLTFAGRMIMETSLQSQTAALFSVLPSVCDSGPMAALYENMM